MRHLIDLNVEKTISLIEKWYDNSYSEQLIMEELNEHKEDQFKFLTKFLHFNEMSIKIVIDQNMISDQKSELYIRYIGFIKLFVTLLC